MKVYKHLVNNHRNGAFDNGSYYVLPKPEGLTGSSLIHKRMPRKQSVVLYISHTSYDNLSVKLSYTYDGIMPTSFGINKYIIRGEVMSVKTSQLSDAQYGGYNMVAALTEKALNAQLRSYLSTVDFSYKAYCLSYGDEKSQTYFLVDKDTDDDLAIPSDCPDALREQIKKLHERDSSLYKEFELLNIFDRNPGEINEREIKLIDAVDLLFLSFAFYIEDGIPFGIMKKLREEAGKPGFNPDSICRILQLQDNANHVDFYQFFKTLIIVELPVSVVRVGGSYVVKHYLRKTAQQDDNPLSFMFDIELDFFGQKYNKLPDDVKKRIQEMSKVQDPDTVFDISQLVLNLEKLSTVFRPKLDVSNPVMTYIENTLIRGYFDRLEKAHQTIFGHVVIPKLSHNSNYLFEPKRYNFTVSNNTLCYLVMFDDTPFPIKSPTYPWRWVEDNETSNGVIVINRDKILTRLLEDFRGTVLQTLRRKAEGRVEGGVYSLTFYYSLNQDESVDSQKFTLNGSEYTYYYSSGFATDTSLVWDPPIPWPMGSGALKMKYELFCNAKPSTLTKDGVTYPSILFSARPLLYLNVTVDSGNNNGNIYDSTLLLNLGIKVNADGSIDFIKDVNLVDNHPGGIDYSGWSQFMTFGMIEDFVKNIKNDLEGFVVDAVNYTKNSFLNAYNVHTGWVMPGNRTFTFKNEGFSDFMDFYSYVNYVQETEGLGLEESSC